jgi:Domain of unknown function (DUF4149)
LQTQLFPIYFSLQTALPVVLALTYPGSRNPFGASSSIRGILGQSNRWSVLVPLATMFVTAVANLAVVLPATRECMEERRVQEKKDGKRSWDAPPHSQEMLALNKRFGMLHGISSLLNLTTFIATIVYGVTLSSRIE